MPGVTKFWDVKAGDFFRYPANSKGAKVYFATLHGNWIFHFPVENGVVRNVSDDSNIYPPETVEVLSLEEVKKLGLPFNADGTLAEDKIFVN
ncbi:MAG: hypothetical protein A3A08_00935 [Candidatus Nealsonbacteria bacterium RIFCSPLOWO2_01_FULL_41_9]|uniref:Uncharacterized protein n=1 Tax=Candidatus Nealsonbacteria bacterium RIFCSPLOWO2_01_FULL_41_9 TaxID=1801671 RepID=A0A1G2EE94_9BACT|nr:MAG: hypothetical protein A3A08_00935 [Candidatus Nealsonbacteria bacterium RIFCSPLOWO2_01_FULL_41_9]